MKDLILFIYLLFIYLFTFYLFVHLFIYFNSSLFPLSSIIIFLFPIL